MIRGIGIDICQKSRIKLNTYKRILTEEEIKLYDQIKLEEKKYDFLAGRFSAKEALFKALSGIETKILMRDIIILNDESGRPFVEKPKFKNLKIWVSISHEIDYAIGQVIVEET
ncbi:MAG: holo-ACP synthase [Candidatus Izemoplasmatales bacterium]